jgi:coenzyme F420-0:L-glutamate ligase/coenzyme F420-1:gamma-L-glutamate ligase
VSLTLHALHCPVQVHQGDDLAALLVDAVTTAGFQLEVGDCVVVTSKVVAKAEGRVVPHDGTDEDKARIVASQTRRVLRRRGPLTITETTHGFVNANAGVDLSNADNGTAVLLPVDPDRSARRLRADLRRLLGLDVAVVITDTFGRAWRHGVVDVAIGVAGLLPVRDLRGTVDHNGRLLEATEVCGVDEVAAAANLVLAKDGGTPFALVRGLDAAFFGEGTIAEHVVRRPHDDLFR